ALARAARRTLVVRVALAAALVGVLAGTVVVARRPESGARVLLPANRTTVLVIDVSASIAGASYKQLLTTLKTVAASSASIGLVFFSDTGYELLPPGAAAHELEPLVRLFTPTGVDKSGFPIFRRNPWAEGFRGGTRISAGLDEARAALERAHVKQGSVLLISDLDEPSSDYPPVTVSILALRRAGVQLRIVPLFAQPKNLAFFQGVVDPSAIVSAAALAPGTRRAQELGFRQRTPVLLLVLGSVLVLLLVANERWCGRLSLAGGDEPA